MINRRTRSHLSCQESMAAVGDIAELPGIVLILNISRTSAACGRVFRRLYAECKTQPRRFRELGVTVNLAMLNKSESIDDR